MSTSLHTVTGADLPELVWHHHQPDDPLRAVQDFRPPACDGMLSKPRGGLWTSVLREHEGLPHSTWGHHPAFRGRTGPWAAYVTSVRPGRGARFLAIDGIEDSRAALAAFCGEPLLPDFPGIDGYGLIDFTRLPEQGLAGVYLTERGESECRHPLPGAPSLWGWDVECVWFALPVFEMHAQTMRWDPV